MAVWKNFSRDFERVQKEEILYEADNIISIKDDANFHFSYRKHVWTNPDLFEKPALFFG